MGASVSKCFGQGSQKKKQKLQTQDQIRERILAEYIGKQILARQAASNNSFGNNNNIPVNYFTQNNQVPNYSNANYNSNNQSYLNPYEVHQDHVQKTQEELLEEQNAKNQEFIAQLKQAGVKVEDYFAYSRLFFQCGACSSPFSQIHKPNLRNCGHMVCNNSKCYQLQCVIPGCKQKSGIKIQGYWPFSNTETETDKNYYDFIITYGNMTDNQDVLKKVDGNRTFQQLLNLCPFAKRYLSTISTQLQALRIKSAQIHYRQIKNKTINSQATQLKLLKSTSLGNNKNYISVINSLLGGYTIQQMI